MVPPRITVSCIVTPHCCQLLDGMGDPVRRRVKFSAAGAPLPAALAAGPFRPYHACAVSTGRRPGRTIGMRFTAIAAAAVIAAAATAAHAQAPSTTATPAPVPEAMPFDIPYGTP